MLDRPTETTIRETVADTVRDVMTARGLDLAGFSTGARLAEGLGLKSMDLAQIVLVLEDELDCDPFQQISITSIRTVDDLVRAYLVGLGLAEAGAPADMSAEIAAARARRTNRRR